MEVAVLVEKLMANGYRATSLGLDAASEAPTREAALDKLSRLLCDKFAGAEVVRLEVPLALETHPWKHLVGRWRDHPDVEEVEEHMQEYRRQVDEQGERL